MIVRGICLRKMLEVVYRVLVVEVFMVLCMIIVSFWIIVCMSLQWYKMDMVEFMKIIVGISYKWYIEQLK